MRAFFAFDIARESIAGLEKIVQSLSLQYGMVKWIKPNDFHITIHFFKEVPKSLLFGIVKEVENSLIFPIRSLTFEIGQLGVFPDRKNPRLIWVGINGETDPLFAMQEKIKKIVLQHDLVVDKRPFFPHITLGRFKKNHGQACVCGLQSYIQNCVARVSIDALTLYQSELTPHGPFYTALHTFPFSF